MNERGNIKPMRTKIRAKLTKIASNHNNLSLNVYTGWVMPDALIIGESFYMDTIQEGMLRTTPVLTVKTIQEKLGGREIVRFRTRNSEYELETEENNGD